jgi:hypothetical protein
VQRLELCAGVPPAMGELAEFLELERVDVDHGFQRSDQGVALVRPGDAGVGFLN